MANCVKKNGKKEENIKKYKRDPTKKKYKKNIKRKNIKETQPRKNIKDIQPKSKRKKYKYLTFLKYYLFGSNQSDYFTNSVGAMTAE